MFMRNRKSVKTNLVFLSSFIFITFDKDGAREATLNDLFPYEDTQSTAQLKVLLIGRNIAVDRTIQLELQIAWTKRAKLAQVKQARSEISKKK